MQSIAEILCSELKSTELSLHLDESALRGSETLILDYVRFVNKKHLRRAQ